MTPWQLRRLAERAGEAQRRRWRQLMTVAWHAGALARSTIKLPRLADFLGKLDGPAAPQSQTEQIAILDAAIRFAEGRKAERR